MAPSELAVVGRLEEVREDGWALRRRVFGLALPAVGEQLLNTAVGLTDQYLVGHLALGVAAALGYSRAMALASVGLSNLMIWIATTLFMTVAVGATTIVARRIGEGREEDANQALVQALLISLGVGAVAMVFCLSFGDWALRALGAPPEVAALGNEYMGIISLSFIPTALMFAGTAALRGAGDTRSPLYLMAVVNVVNMALAWLLVNGMLGFPAMGVQGAAIATMIARTLSGVLLLALLARGRLRLRFPRAWRPDQALMGRILRIGLPSAGEQFIFQGAVIIMSRLITELGVAAYAAHSVTVSIESVSFLPGYGFAIAATTLVGQALGAQRPDVAERATWEALKQGGLLMSLLGLIMALWPATVVSWIAPDPAVIEQATWPLRLAGLGQTALAFAFIFIGALRGAGDTTWPLYMRVVSTWFVRIPIIFILMQLTEWSLASIWFAMCADFFVQGFLALRRFQSGKWKAIRV